MRETDIQMRLVGNPTDLSVRDFLTPLFRRKRLLLVTFFFVLAAIIILAALRGPAYASRMAILVNQERLDPLVSTEATNQIVAPQNPVTPEEINSEVELLSSRDVLEQVVIANGLNRPADGFSLGSLLHPHQTANDRIARAVKSLAKQLKIANIKNSNLIEVSYKSSDPQRSYGVLKSLGDLYVSKHVAVHRPAGSFEFFARETQKYHDELERAEAKLRNFGRKYSIAAPDVQRTQLAAQVANSVGLMHAAEQSIAADQDRIKDDRKQMSKTSPRLSRVQTSAAADKLLDQLNETLLSFETRRTTLLTRYDPSYPLVQDLDQQITQTNRAIAEAEKAHYSTESTDVDPTFEALREDRSRTQADRAAQLAALAATKRSIKDIETQMVNLDQLSLAQQDLQRDAKADENNYLLYLAKREQERTTNALDATRIANVAIAVPPAIPVLPVFSWPMIMFIAFCSATILGLGTAYAADYFDSSFRTPAQLTEGLGIPVVVVFPKRIA
jgi:uncharacterized protein involved in exopolysaccharide biosynthesis